MCVCVCSFWDMRSSCSMLSQLFIVYNNIELHIFNCNEVLTRQIHKKNQLSSLSVMLLMLIRLVYLLQCSNKGSGAVAVGGGIELQLEMSEMRIDIFMQCQSDSGSEHISKRMRNIYKLYIYKIFLKCMQYFQMI